MWLERLFLNGSGLPRLLNGLRVKPAANHAVAPMGLQRTILTSNIPFVLLHRGWQLGEGDQAGPGQQ